MSWNYRVVVTREKDLVNPDEWVFDFTIRDVYYDENNKPKGYGADPQFPCGEEFTDLLSDFRVMAEALRKPVLFLCDVTEELSETPTDGDWCYTPDFDKPLSDSNLTATEHTIEEQNKRFRQRHPGHPPPFPSGNIDMMAEMQKQLDRIQHERDKALKDRMQMERDLFLYRANPKAGTIAIAPEPKAKKGLIERLRKGDLF